METLGGVSYCEILGHWGHAIEGAVGNLTLFLLLSLSLQAMRQIVWFCRALPDTMCCFVIAQKEQG
jgi:hypothetical protein